MVAIQNNISLLPYNTFGINVMADFFAEINSDEELISCLKSDISKQNSLLIIGGGSNILLSHDFNGLVIRMNTKGISLVSEDDTHVFIKASAGEIWDELVNYCTERNYGGIENLSMIPGCVGASPVQNIGAYGVELKDVFYSLEAVHVKDLVYKTFTATEGEFGYRDSSFKRCLKDQYIIVSVTLKLSKHPVPSTSYAALNEEIEKMGIENITIKTISQAVCAIRSRKLPDPAVLGNAGSFFKNPVVTKEKYNELRLKFGHVPSFPADEGHVKIPAGWLIEQCGWKGKRMGDAGVHSEQALVLVNYGNATAEELLQLADSIVSDIHQRFGIKIDKEVNVI